jgi:hypothetical protein
MSYNIYNYITKFVATFIENTIKVVYYRNMPILSPFIRDDTSKSLALRIRSKSNSYKREKSLQSLIPDSTEISR